MTAVRTRIRSTYPYHIPLLFFIIFIGVGLFWGAVQPPPAADHTGPPASLMMPLNFLYIGAVTSGCMVWMWRSPAKKKNRARRVSLFAVGLWLVLLAGLMGTQNLQLEGFFFSLLSGAVAGGLVHYSVSKVFGPLVLGRSWCGWGCWTAMVLDSLPFKRSPGRRPQRWLRWLPYAHFGASLALVLVLWHAVGYQPDMHSWGLDMLLWFVIGNALYYAVAIAMAFALKDNRAFCKYLCPVNVPIRIGARFSLAKIGSDAAKCTGCDACSKMCPMDIRVSEYAKNGQRVLSTECIMCQACVNVCAKDAIRLSLGLDVSGDNRLRYITDPVQPRRALTPAAAPAPADVR